MRVSVVVPVFDEAATVVDVVERVLAPGLVYEVIVVDDGSTDDTPRELDRLRRHAAVQVLRHPVNRGKGAALRTGFAAARGDVVLVQDADLEYDPADHPRLLLPFRDPAVMVVYGSRFLGARWARRRFHHWFGNRVLTMVSNLCTGQRLTDMETCYKVLRREVLTGFRIRSERFTVEPELTAKISRLGHHIHEVPIRYAGRSYSAGKKIGWRDGVAALWAIFRYRWFD